MNKLHLIIPMVRYCFRLSSSAMLCSLRRWRIRKRRCRKRWNISLTRYKYWEEKHVTWWCTRFVLSTCSGGRGRTVYNFYLIALKLFCLNSFAMHKTTILTSLYNFHDRSLVYSTFVVWSSVCICDCTFVHTDLLNIIKS